jgi:hypothetical protein
METLFFFLGILFVLELIHISIFVIVAYRLLKIEKMTDQFQRSIEDAHRRIDSIDVNHTEKMENIYREITEKFK